MEGLTRKQPFPFNGQVHYSKQKKYEEVVLFVPFYDSRPRQLLGHVRLVNQLGFDAFTFELQEHNLLRPVPLNQNKVIGLKHVYADQIEILLNILPGKKIVFAFSNPSAAAIEALSKRQTKDITALICDSGPSSRLIKSAIALGRKYLSQKNWRQVFLVGGMVWAWSLRFHQDLDEHLRRFSQGFPILSIRGWKDALISPKDIDEVFQNHQNISWEKLSLPEAGHLDGLKLFPDLYREGLIKFISHLTLTKWEEKKN